MFCEDLACVGTVCADVRKQFRCSRETTPQFALATALTRCAQHAPLCEKHRVVTKEKLHFSRYALRCYMPELSLSHWELCQPTAQDFPHSTCRTSDPTYGLEVKSSWNGDCATNYQVSLQFPPLKFTAEQSSGDLLFAPNSKCHGGSSICESFIPKLKLFSGRCHSFCSLLFVSL